MARYKPVDTSPRQLPVILEHQLPAGTFEHALYHLIDHEMSDELAAFDRNYLNDITGAPAYAPAMLLKVDQVTREAAGLVRQGAGGEIANKHARQIWAMLITTGLRR